MSSAPTFLFSTGYPPKGTTIPEFIAWHILCICGNNHIYIIFTGARLIFFCLFQRLKCIEGTAAVNCVIFLAARVTVEGEFLSPKVLFTSIASPLPFSSPEIPPLQSGFEIPSTPASRMSIEHPSKRRWSIPSSLAEAHLETKKLCTDWGAFGWNMMSLFGNVAWIRGVELWSWFMIFMSFCESSRAQTWSHAHPFGVLLVVSRMMFI